MKHEAGATLLVTLIMLLLMTLAAVTTFNLGRGNLQVVSNQQHREEAEASATAALEEVFSKAVFSESPSTPFGGVNEKTYDVNGDGTADITVTVGNAADTNNPAPCIKQASPAPDTAGCETSVKQEWCNDPADCPTATSNALCSKILWEVTAVARDTTTQASVTAAMGISTVEASAKAANTANYCQ